MNDNFRYVETKRAIGLVGKVKALADKADRSLNNYVEQVLKKHVEENKEL